MQAVKSRPLPQLPTERPLPELPSQAYDTLPPARSLAKTPPPSRRAIVEHDIDTPPPLPPISSLHMVKSQSAFFNQDKIHRPSLPDTSTRPPLPPRKASVPGSSHYGAGGARDSTTTSPQSADRSSLYDIPKSSKMSGVGMGGVGRGPSSTSLDAMSVCSLNIGRTSSPSISYVPVSESMTLKQLVAYHQNEFPLRVEVTAGYFGNTECDTFSEGDRLNFHFIKQVSVAVIETMSGQKVKIPLNSAARFSLIYNPNNETKEVLEGFVFKSVKDVLAQKDMPKVITATKAHGNPSSNNSHSVEAGELLLINEVKHGRFGGQSLICTSLASNKQKRLPENCQGFFTTAPDSVMMYLPELTKRFELPLKVIVSDIPRGGKGDGGRVPDSLTAKELVTIVGIDKEMTLIATPVPDEDESDTDSSDDSSFMFDIPVDLDVLEVQIIEQKNDADFEKLYVDTRLLLNSFDPSKLDKQVRVGKQDDIYYTAVHEGHKNVGVELLAGEGIYSEPRPVLTNRRTENGIIKSEQSSNSSSPLPQIIEPKPELSQQIPPPSNGQNDYYAMDVVSTSKQSPTRSPAVRSPVPHSPVPHCSTPMQDTPLYMVSKLMMNGQSDVDELRREVIEMKGSIMSLKQQMEGLQKIVADLQSSTKTNSSTANGHYVEMLPPTDSIVSKMSFNEVLQMLDKLNLSQYKEVFEKEDVDGPLLSELDEDTLKNELGMTSKIHRKKLLLVIQGKQTYQHLVVDS